MTTPCQLLGDQYSVSLPYAQVMRALNSGYIGHVVVSHKEAKVLRIILKIFVFYPFPPFFLFKNNK